MTQHPTPKQELDTLAGQTTGSYLVETEASYHLIDLDARTVTRTRIGERGFEPSHLRRDGSEINLVDVDASVGSGMILILDLRGDGIPTVRLSTDVVRIRRLIAPD
jgi:hypothetical protein